MSIVFLNFNFNLFQIIQISPFAVFVFQKREKKTENKKKHEKNLQKQKWKKIFQMKLTLEDLINKTLKIT